MPHLKFFKDINKNSVAEAGGKGASLGELTKAGIPVPPGFVVLANAFDRFLEETDLNVEIKARLKAVNIDDTNSIDKASAVIRDAIHDRAMPKDLEVEILKAFGELRDSSSSRSAGLARNDSNFFVAVRSSATAEDGAVASWAGELETFLNTTEKDILDNVKKCWSSLFTPRAIFYRHEKKLIDHYVSVAVVVQQMVQSEISGIAFTVHPVTEDRDQMIIEAGYGLGEAIVSGSITPDSYIVSKSALSILDINVSTQSRKLIRRKVEEKKNKKIIKNKSKKMVVGNAQARSAKTSNDEEDKRNIWVEISESEGSKQKLTGKEILEAAKIFINIEKHYKFPCDIEWAMQGGKLYITQSRPITTLK